MNDIQFSCGSAKAIAVTGRQKWYVYLASQEQMAASAIAMFKSANNLTSSSSVTPRVAPIVCAMLFQWPGGVSVPEPSAQNKSYLGLIFCARRTDKSTELFDLLVVRSVLLAFESRRPGRTKLRWAAHSKRRDESPLRQQIRKKRRRRRNP